MTARWPPEVAHLPVCPVRKLPVPYITPWEDGRAAYTALDPQRKDECIAGRLCALCGRPMGWWIAFLCDETSLLRGSYSIEPPLHERCAELAAVGDDGGGGLCPFVSREQVPRRPATGKDVLVCPPDSMTGVPKRPMVIAICRDYRTRWIPAHGGGATLVYLPGTVKRVRRFRYSNGLLTEVATDGPARRSTRKGPR